MSLYGIVLLFDDQFVQNFLESFSGTGLNILRAFTQVAILDGITMGCGAGISLPGMYQVVTDKTVCDFFGCSLNLCLVNFMISKCSQLSLFGLKFADFFSPRGSNRFPP